MKFITPVLILFFLIIFISNAESYLVRIDNRSTSNLLNSSKLKPAIPQLQNLEKNISKIQRLDDSLITRLSSYFIIRNDQDLRLLVKEFGSEILELVEPNYYYKIETLNSPPNDNDLQLQWALKQINAQRAWKTATGSGVIIGLIDTGIDFEHPEFEGQLWINTPEDINGNGKLDPWPSDSVNDDGISGDFNGIDDDGNGYPDDIIGYDFVDQSVFNIGDATDPDGYPFDDANHGTSVGGIMAAKTNNNLGIAGLAFDAKILTVRCFDVSGNAESDDIAAGIVYAVMNGAKVLNFSFGERYKSAIIEDAVNFAHAMGCFMASSAGNSNSIERHFPSGLSNVMTVGGTSENGSKYGDGNYGSMLDICAPALGVYTTEVGGYKKTNGTSLAAPYVSATAALLLEINPDLTPDEITGILLSSARDAGEQGWDKFFGNGILDAAAALEAIPTADITISHPGSEVSVNKDKQIELKLRGTISTPLMESYRIYIGEGILPKVFQPVSDVVSDAKFDEEIGVIKLKDLKDTVYTINIEVTLKNRNTINRRIYLFVNSDNSKLAVKIFKATPIWVEGVRSLLVTVATNYETKAFVSLEVSEFIKDDYIFDKDLLSEYHSFVLPFYNKFQKPQKGKVHVYRPGIDTIVSEFNVTFDDESFPVDGFNRKNYTLPLSNINNEVGDLYGNSGEYFAFNDLSTLAIGNTFTCKFDNGKIAIVDSSEDRWIPVGFGDSNGDGIREILGTGNFESILTQREGDSSPFSNVLFKSNPSDIFWGAGMVDLDGDGREEIIAYSDTSYFAYTFNNGNYEFLAVAELPEDLKRFGVDKGFGAGDFDGDGYIEISFTNARGNIFIYQFKDGKFNYEYSFEQTVSFSNQYMCTPDVDGDGSPEILSANYGNVELYGISSPLNQIWKLRLIKATSIDRYDEIWDDHFNGVRAGLVPRLNLSYKNGVSCGNIDGEPGDEAILSTFPNFYVFKWDGDSKILKPFWYFPAAYSNSALVHDVDGNGQAELGFNTFNSTEFYEYEKTNAPRTPTKLLAEVYDNKTVTLSWLDVPGADEYVIYRLIRQDGLALIGEYARTNDDIFVFDTLTPGIKYQFVVQAIWNSPSSESGLSNIADAFLHNPFNATSLININKTYLEVQFDGDLTGAVIAPQYFKITEINSFKQFNPANAFAGRNFVTLVLGDTIPSGTYTLLIESFRDQYGTRVNDTLLDFTVQWEAPEPEIVLRSLDFVPGSDLLKLRYSEEVDSSALKIENYTVWPIGRIDFAEFDPFDNEVVTLIPSNAIRHGARGRNYILSVENVTAPNGHKITTGAGKSLGFVLSANNLENPFVYPNPIRLSENNQAYFGNITNRAEVTIYDANGSTLRILDELDGNGGLEWDRRDSKGKILEPGIYFYEVRGTNLEGIEVESELQKFMITP